MTDLLTTRRRFLAYFSGAGLTSTLLPGTLWARMQEQQAAEITPEMIQQAAAVSGMEFTTEQAEGMAQGVNRKAPGAPQGGRQAVLSHQHRSVAQLCRDG